MAHFYVRDNGGTFTGTKTTGGGDGSPRTGAWDATASNSYGKVVDAITDGAGNGDFIYVASDHQARESAGAWVTWGAGGTGATDNPGLTIISVDKDNQDQYLKGAVCQSGSSNDSILLAGVGTIYGLKIDHTNDFGTNSDNAYWRLIEVDSVCDGSSDFCYICTSDGCYLELYNCTGEVGNTAGSYFNLSKGGTIRCYGFSIVAGAAATVDELVSVGTTNAGARAYFYGCDFDNGSVSIGDLVKSIAASNADNVEIKFFGCKKNASTGFMPAAEFEAGGRKELTFIGVDSSDEHVYHYRNNAITVDSETTTVVTSQTAFPDGTKMSFKVSSLGNIARENPEMWQIPIVQFIDAQVAASDTIKLHITTDATVNDEDLDLVLGFPDVTDPVIEKYADTGNMASIANNLMAEPLVTDAVALATESGVWTSAKTNQYSLSVTPGTANVHASAGYGIRPMLRISKDFGANPIYVHTELETS